MDGEKQDTKLLPYCVDPQSKCWLRAKQNWSEACQQNKNRIKFLLKMWKMGKHSGPQPLW